MSTPQFTTNSLTSWLSHMKTDDIDDGLAADFDGSLSGLGVELGSSTYNMSEALLALPVFKEDTTPQGFQYILSAATSPATKLYEETLTYLNQGQPYEIKVKKLGDAGALKGKRLQSIVRVMFHERRLQYNEKEQLDFWMKNRPGERIVDVDVPLSYGVQEVKVSRSKLNCIELTWDPCTDCGIFIKINAISTEFTPRKHGGEKGVPFRIQVETYTREDGRLLHGASCQVKVFKPKGADRKHKTDREKIEKRSEAEKAKYQPSYECTVLAEIPLDQIHSYLKLLEGQEQGTPKLADTKPTDTTTQMPTATATSKSPLVSTGQRPREEPTAVTGKKKLAATSATTAGDIEVSSVSQTNQESSPNVFCIKDLAEFLDNSQNSSCDSSGTVVQRNTKTSVQPEPLSPRATAHQVTQWLHNNRFSNFVKIFENFAGADLLRLTRDDLVQICGLADGIRLDNALQSRTVRPKLTIYVNQPRRYSGNFYGGNPVAARPDAGDAGLWNNNSLASTSTAAIAAATAASSVQDTPKQVSVKLETSPTSCTAAAVRVVSKPEQPERDITSVTQSLTQPVAVPSTSGNPSAIASVTIPEAGAVPSIDPPHKLNLVQVYNHPTAAALPTSSHTPSAAIVKSSPKTSPTHQQSSTSTSQEMAVTVSTPSHTVAVTPTTPHKTNDDKRPTSDNLGDKRLSSGGAHQGWKRHFRDEPDADAEEMYYTKKQRTRTLELSSKGVYHAVYLEFLTVDHLKEKLAELFSISGQQILEIHVQGPSGILVLVTDNVVMNLQHQTRYNIEAYEDDVLLGFYKVLLQSNS